MAEFFGPCTKCGGYLNRFDQPCYCLEGLTPPAVCGVHGEKIPCGTCVQKPQEEHNQRMSKTAETFENVVSIGAARFNKISQSPQDCNPRDALEAAIAYLDFDEDKPDHIIVLFGRTPTDGGSATKWFQAGSYEYHAQMGLLYEGAQMIRDNG